MKIKNQEAEEGGPGTRGCSGRVRGAAAEEEEEEEGEGQAPGDERLDPREGSRGKLTESERDPPVAPGEEKEGNPSSSHSRPRLLTPPAPPYPFPGICLLLFPVTSTESPQPLTVRRGGESRGRTTAGAGS
ncbi:hypothetical protein B296_00010904 [Ensete ventricosum]|uniref:Uncharacterized protein n=1 Tax=Ensete ventricosum TaxID=4639 RepID=A0A427AGV1_ENSVE|nr:hypothetical protein B296_00010904 [Ensete ventricosum]